MENDDIMITWRALSDYELELSILDWPHNIHTVSKELASRHKRGSKQVLAAFGQRLIERLMPGIQEWFSEHPFSPGEIGTLRLKDLVDFIKQEKEARNQRRAVLCKAGFKNLLSKES